MSRTQKNVSRSSLAGILRRARQKQGVSPVELALKSGVSVASIYSIERGATEKPALGTLKKLVAALGLESWKVAHPAGYSVDDLDDNGDQ